MNRIKLPSERIVDLDAIVDIVSPRINEHGVCETVATTGDGATLGYWGEDATAFYAALEATLVPTPASRCVSESGWREFQAWRAGHAAERSAGAEPTGLVWTSERPKVPGPYLCKMSDGKCHAFHVSDGHMRPDGAAFLDRYYRGCLWAGPIPEPAEPKG